MTRRAGLVEAQVIHQEDDEIGLFLVSRRTAAIFSWHNVAMTPRAITIRLAEPRDAQAIATMSRDFIESGLGWKYDAARVLRAMRDRETLAVVACEGAKGAASSARSAVAGFAIMEFGDERAHLVLLAVRPSHRRLGIGQRMLDWLLDSARVAGMASIHLELRRQRCGRRFYVRWASTRRCSCRATTAAAKAARKAPCACCACCARRARCPTPGARRAPKTP